MYLLSKLETISKDKEQEILKRISQKNSINDRELYYLKNPLHLKNANLVNIKEYKSIYEIVNNSIIIKNEKLSELITEKSEDDLKRILINSYRDNMFSNSFMEEYFNNPKFNCKKIKYMIYNVKILLNELYSSDTSSSTEISKKKLILEKKDNRSFEEDMLLYILKNRATRFSLIAIINKLTKINKDILNISSENIDINNFLQREEDTHIIFSKRKFDSLFNNDFKNNPRYVTSYDSYNMLKFKNIKEIESSLNEISISIHNENLYIYLDKNNLIIKEISYIDFLKIEDGYKALEKILEILSSDNLNYEFINHDFINYVHENKLVDIAKLLVNKYKVVDKLLLETNNLKPSSNKSSNSILAMINKRYA